MADNGSDLAAKRYAQAAFELALEANDLATWESALDQIGQFMGEPEVSSVLENTRAAKDAKLQLIEAALNDLPAMPLNLARLLVRKQRTGLAPEIAVQFRAMVQERSGIRHVKASTAVALTDTERLQLTARLRETTGHEVVLETAVDPALLGGLVVQIGDRLIDASTRHRLQELRKSLEGVNGVAKDGGQAFAAARSGESNEQREPAVWDHPPSPLPFNRHREAGRRGTTNGTFYGGYRWRSGPKR